MKTILSIALAALALSACAPHPVAIVHCVTPEQYQKLKNAEPPKVGSKLTGQAQDDLKIIAGRTVELQSWGEGLLGVIAGCSGE